MDSGWFRRFLGRLGAPGLAKVARRLGIASAFAAAALLASPTDAGADEPVGASAPRPNIIMIMADDLGYGDVGFNGQQDVATPNIDALAQGGTITTRDQTQVNVGAGMMYTGMYCPASICTPTRAALMTGMHTGHVVADRNTGAGVDYPLNPADITVGDVLQYAGYATGMVGKWGLGPGTRYDNPTLVSENLHSAPTNKGFDYFYGYLNQVRAHDYEVPSLWESDESAPEGLSLSPTNGVHTHDLVTDKAVQYVADHAVSLDPFYLQVNFTPPHFDIDAVPQRYRDPYEGLGWSDKKVKSAAMIAHLDATVGDVLNSVYDPDSDGNTDDSIADETLVVFCSDNGPAEEDGADPDFFDSSGPYKGKKRDLYEGGIRTPFAVRWDGVIAPGTNTTYVGGLEDFLPTAAELAGAEAPIGVDGISMLPSFLGDEQPQRDWLVWEFHENSPNITGSSPARWAIRKDGWKLIKFKDGHYELYDLATDIDESNNVVSAHPTLKSELEAIALAEGVEQPNGHSYVYRTWQGASPQANWYDAGNWSDDGLPAGHWIATLDALDADLTAVVSADSEVLGLQLGATTGEMTVRVDSGATLRARNGVRIAGGGDVTLRGGALSTFRQIDLRGGGRLGGSGSLLADELLNAGTVSPGQASGDTTGSGETVNTGTVPALEFDFVGVQDDAPLTATSTLSEHLTLSAGLDFGPGTQSKQSESGTDVTNAGDEFNVVGFESDSLAGAIGSSDYLTYTVAPAAGLRMKLDEAHFRLWRNGANAATDYAILASHIGFADGDALVQMAAPNTGSDEQYTLSGAPSEDVWTSGAIEVRLYGWGGQLSGNTHVNAAGMDASFESVPGETFGPRGVMTLSGDYTQTADGRLAIELADTDNTDGDDAGFDQLLVSGHTQLAGTLELSLVDGAAPAYGTEFVILDAESLEGRFQTILGVGQGDRSLAVTYDEANASTLVTVALPADANLDEAVDFDDAWMLLDSYKTGATGLGWGEGDFNGDGVVDDSDATILLDAYAAAGTIEATQAAGMLIEATGVPEPTTIVLLALSGGWLLRRRR
jgi:arylsulfatase A-like enzyme